MDDLGPTAVERSLGALIPGLLVEGSFKEVLRALRRAPSPGFASQWHLWRAQAHLGLGAWAQAEEAARLGSQTCGEDRAKSLALADALQGQGRLAEAEGIYLDLIAGAPRDVELLGRYALLCALGGKLERARECVSLAEATHPLHPGLQAIALRIRWLAGDDLPTGELCDSLILTPQDPEGAALRAEWRLRRATPEDALRGWDALMATLPPGTDVDAIIRAACKHPGIRTGSLEIQGHTLALSAVALAPGLLIELPWMQTRLHWVILLPVAFVAVYSSIDAWRRHRKRRALLAIAKAWRARGPERIPQSLLPPPPRPTMKAGEHGVHRPPPSSMTKRGQPAEG